MWFSTESVCACVWNRVKKFNDLESFWLKEQGKESILLEIKHRIWCDTYTTCNTGRWWALLLDGDARWNFKALLFSRSPMKSCLAWVFSPTFLSDAIHECSFYSMTRDDVVCAAIRITWFSSLNGYPMDGLHAICIMNRRLFLTR